MHEYPSAGQDLALKALTHHWQEHVWVCDDTKMASCSAVHSYGGSWLARINTRCRQSVRWRITDRAAAAGASHLCCTGGAKVRPEQRGIETNYSRSIFSRTGAISSSNSWTGKKDKFGDYRYTEREQSTSLNRYPTCLLKQAVMMERPGT